MKTNEIINEDGIEMTEYIFHDDEIVLRFYKDLDVSCNDVLRCRDEILKSRG